MRPHGVRHRLGRRGRGLAPVSDRPAAPPDGPRALPESDRRMLESLVCPVTHGPLTLDAAARELISRHARLAYPIRDGIPIMLEDEARRLED